MDYDVTHVYPTNDLYPHNTEETGNCMCCPKFKEVKTGVIFHQLMVLHHAFDHRERFEEGYEEEDDVTYH